MKAILSIAVALVLLFSLCGCSASNNEGNTIADMYKQAAQSYIDSGDTDSAIKALEEGIAATQDETLKRMLEELKTASTTGENGTTSAATPDETVVTTTAANVQTTTTTNPTTTTTAVSKVNCADYNGEWSTSGFSWESGGFYLSLDVQGSVINVECSEVQAVTERIAEVSVVANTSMLVGDTLTVGFQDSWGNCGMLKLTFKSGQILCSVSDVQEPDMMSPLWGVNEGEKVLTPYKKPTTTQPSGGLYDDIVGSYQDALGVGFNMDIEYTDNSKTKAVVWLYLAAGDYEVPIVNRDGNTIFARLMSDGSEPVCAVELYYSAFDGYVTAEVYISSVDYCDTISFCPTWQYY